MDFGRRFFATYASPRTGLRIIDIGAQDVNGSLRAVAPADAEYVGVDFVAGKGVDVIIDDPYALPFPDASADLIVCSSCMEHSEFFWLLFIEMIRVLKPDGVLYVNAPSNGALHRYPVDCWRFYPDSGIALRNWSRQSGYQTELLESFIGPQVAPDTWNDFVGVFIKKASPASPHCPRTNASPPIRRFPYVSGSRTGCSDGATPDPDHSPSLSSTRRSQAEKLCLDRRSEATGTAGAARNLANASSSSVSRWMLSGW